MTAAYLHWSHLTEVYGLDEAMLMCRVMSAHPSAFQSLVTKYNLDVDVRESEAVDIYDDQDLFERAVMAAQSISEYLPESFYQVYDAKEAQDKFRVSSRCVGAIAYNAGQLDSYAFVTQLAEVLINHGMNLQTQTTVNEIRKDEGKWSVETSRGNILTSQIVHATNGYISLIPALSAIIKPSRGHVSALIPPVELLHFPLERAYCFVYTTGEFDYLIQQRSQDGGMLIWGGGWNEDPEPYTNDDSGTSRVVEDYLRSQINEVVPWTTAEACTWTGIMGFSADELPWVGQLPASLGGGEGQWYCGGYTGEGLSF
jgi:glycine/D-amino acid oxidase-like deaminating enzyme